MLVNVLFLNRHAEKFRFDIHKVQNVDKKYQQVLKDCEKAAIKERGP
jgi:hypothetical protein